MLFAMNVIPDNEFTDYADFAVVDINLEVVQDMLTLARTLKDACEDMPNVTSLSMWAGDEITLHCLSWDDDERASAFNDDLRAGGPFMTSHDEVDYLTLRYDKLTYCEIRASRFLDEYTVCYTGSGEGTGTFYTDSFSESELRKALEGMK